MLSFTTSTAWALIALAVSARAAPQASSYSYDILPSSSSSGNSSTDLCTITTLAQPTSVTVIETQTVTKDKLTTVYKSLTYVTIVTVPTTLTETLTEKVTATISTSVTYYKTIVTPVTRLITETLTLAAETATIFTSLTYTTTVTTPVTRLLTETVTETKLVTAPPETVTQEVTTTVTTSLTFTTTTTLTKLLTTTITAPAPSCPTGNLILNPGFETPTAAWTLGPGTAILKTAPGQGADENVLVATFSGPSQTRTASQPVGGLCPGRTYLFRAEVQMWTTTAGGNAVASFYLGSVMIGKSAALGTGAWVVVAGTVVAAGVESVLRVDVVSGGGGTERRFVVDDLVLQVI